MNLVTGACKPLQGQNNLAMAGYYENERFDRDSWTTMAIQRPAAMLPSKKAVNLSMHPVQAALNDSLKTVACPYARVSGAGEWRDSEAGHAWCCSKNGGISQGYDSTPKGWHS